MREVLLVRHAKSSWDDTSIPDFDRPLNKRGKSDAPFMGKILADRGVHPDAFIASPAKRARKTAFILAEKLGFSKEALRFDKGIYGATQIYILETIRLFDDSWHRVILVGHNPETTAAAVFLTGAHIENVPTCGIVCARFEGNSWKDITQGSCELAYFEYPKKYR